MATPIIKCDACKHEYTFEEGAKSVTVADGVIQHGLLCPGCNLFTHSFFETARVREERQKLEKARERGNFPAFKVQQDVYKRVFADEQTRWNRRRKPVTEAA